MTSRPVAKLRPRLLPPLLSLLALGLLPHAAKAVDTTWYQAAHRYEDTYDARAIGNMGLQFQRVIAWNQGTADPTKDGWIVTGQDENGVRVSYDYGATWGSPRLSGVFCSRIAGLYLNTDDDLLVVMGGHFSDPNFTSVTDRDGIYVGDGSLLQAQRVEITRPSGPGPDAPGGGKRAFTDVSYAGNSFDRNGNFLARRPQTGGLTDAQRPIWALEQTLASNAIAYIGLFKSTDGGASFDFVRELPISDYASGNAGLYHILAAPNGDIVVLGKRGVWISADQGANFTKKYPASGDSEVSSGFFYGGSVSTPSSMRIGVYTADANGGVWETTNIDSNSFTRKNNTGLPANYRVWHLGGSPVNPNRLAVCTDGDNPYYSTDGGNSFNPVTQTKGVGDVQWRYNIKGQLSGGHAGFHFCPTDEMKCLIPTAQTMARSVDGAVTANGDLVAGFDGMHTKGYGFDTLSGDWAKILRTCQDSFINLSTDGMHWVKSTGLGTGNTTFKDDLNAAGAGSNSYVSGAGGVICTDTRAIAGANRNTAGQTNVMTVVDFDANGNATYHLRNTGTKSRCTFSFRNPKNDDMAFVGCWSISNLQATDQADITFTNHPGHEIFDCFKDGSTLNTYWSNVAPGNPNGTIIYRSTADDGGNQSTWYTLTTSAFSERAVCADHFNSQRVLYVRNDNKDVIREIKLVGGQLQDTVLQDGSGNDVNIGNLIRAALAAENPGVSVPTGATAITQLLSDPYQANVFYAIAGLQGMPNWWRSEDGGSTWTNISGNAPRTLWTGVIHPQTGELMGFSSMGEYIHKSPDDIAGYSAPHRDALSGQISDYLALHPHITTTSLPHAYLNSAYAQTLASTDGDGAKTWSLAAGALPGGLSLSSAGVISGTPNTAGTFTFDVKVADSDSYTGPTDEDIQTLTIVVNAGADLSIPQASSAPTIDGAIEGIWAQADRKVMANLVRGTINGSADFSGSFRTLWDADNLYILAEVTDDIQVNDSGSTLWYDDSVEVYLDANHDGTSTYGATDFRYYFAWNGSSVSIQEAAHGATGGVVAARAAVSGGYVMEIKIPWSTLQQSSVAVGAPIGIDVHANDDDDGGDRDATISWFNTADTSWQDPTTFAVAELAAGAADTAPTISNLNDQTIDENENTGALAFTVGDAESDAGALTVSGSSSNQALVPDANITFGGGGTSRTVTVTPVADASGTATITVTVSDGDLTDYDTFLLTVNSPAIGDFPANEDIGNPGQAGSASYDSGTGLYTVAGGGTDIFGTSDQFHFVHQPWSGDGRIIARVASENGTQNWAKAGVMFRESTAADAKNTDLVVTSTQGTQLLWRGTTGGTTQYVTDAGPPPPVAPYWLKLERHGDTFTGWQSPDGAMWFLTAATTYTMNSAAQVGLAVTAHNDTLLNTATFDHVSVGDVPAWTAADIGAVGATGSTAVDYTTDTYTVNGAGANIYGTADAFHFYYQALSGDVTIIAAVTSVQNTNGYAKGGVMIRQNVTDADAPHAYVGVTAGSEVEFLRRTTSGGTTGRDFTSSVAAPRFVKLVRSGDTFTAYYLDASSVWVQLGSPVTIAMTGTVYVGLVSNSHVAGTLCTSTFDSVFVQ